MMKKRIPAAILAALIAITALGLSSGDPGGPAEAGVREAIQLSVKDDGHKPTGQICHIRDPFFGVHWYGHCS